jgi:hypothetical protein
VAGAVQPPAAGQQPPAQAEAPKLAFTAPAGMLLVTVKKDQTATFDEMATKIRATGKAGSWKFYRASEPTATGDVMYVIVIDPAAPNTEYQFFQVIQNSLSDEEKRNPATQDMYKKWAAAIASMSKLNVTPLSGGL